MFKRSVVKKIVSLLAFAVLFILPGPTSAESNNCCFAGWRCESNEEWVRGYYANQNNQCGASQPQHAASPQALSPRAPDSINNCCFIGWQCNTNEEWVGGYYAFQADQCDSSQAQWQGQWRQRQNSNQQAQSSRSRQRQRNNNQQEQEQQSQPLSVVLDVTNHDTNEQETTQGVPVTINHGTNEQKCRWFPSLDACQYPELYD
jgi:hypothetical protein